MKNLFKILYWIFILNFFVEGGIKRNRAEGVSEVLSSNSIGFGNIWGETHMRAYNRGKDFVIEPFVYGGIGVADFMSVAAGMVPFEKGLIGKSQIEAKITIPGNDNLRLIGLGVVPKLVLLTEEDTLSIGVDETRPAYTPFFGVTACLDIDLVKYLPMLPIKLYGNISNIDEDRLLIKYKQISIRGAIEYKDEKNSYFLTSRSGFYKGKRTVEKPKEDLNYGKNILSLGGGARIRPWSAWFFERINIMVSARAIVVSNDENLEASKWGCSVAAEMPVFFRESNAEALRALIYLNRKKVKINTRKDLKNQKRGIDHVRDLIQKESGDSDALKDLIKSEDSSLSRQREKIERRKKIDNELEKIEELLE